MRVSDTILNTVVFLGYPSSAPGKGGIECIGTGFLLLYDGAAYLVTARHVAEHFGSDPFLIRANRYDRTGHNIHVDQTQWYFAGACLRQSGSAQPTTRFSICLGVGLNRRRLRPPEAVQRLRSGGGKGPQPPAASYRALRASARRGGGAWHDSTVRNLLARAGCSGG
jgi:hypothetical protein